MGAARWTPHARALAAYGLEVIVEDDGTRLFAPVTSRGEAVGVLELGLGLEDFPAEQTVADGGSAPRSVPLSLAAEKRPSSIRRIGRPRWYG